MTESDKRTEEKILEAAQRVFVDKGMHGARMQEIANEAKINKSLLHYYYRSKELLFKAVFKVAVKKFVPKIEAIIYSDASIFEKIEMFVEGYMEILLKNQFIPMFVLQEINRDPDMLVGVMMDSGINPKPFIKNLENAIEAGDIIQINPRQLIVNMASLCIFPIAARPMMQRLFFDNDKKVYSEFLQERKTEVSKFIINSIRKK